MKIMWTTITKILCRTGFTRTTFLIMRIRMPSTGHIEVTFQQGWHHCGVSVGQELGTELMSQ